MKTPSGWLFWLLLTLATSGGASCRQLTRTTDPGAPIAFAGPPTLEEVLYAVNTNSARIQQLSTDSATLATRGVPTLRAKLAIERPLRIRLRGRLIGDELDLGSNNELFWFWAKSDPEQALYYSYHEQFLQGADNRVLPVGPDWLIEAIGLVQLDPAGGHDGPTQRPDGSWEIRSRLDRRGAGFTRKLIIDGKYGWIIEQQVLDLQGRLLAISRCSNHRFYPQVGAALPHRIQIELPPAQLAFQLEVREYAVNQLAGDAESLFKLPHFDGYRLVNLSEPVLPMQQPIASPTSAYSPQPLSNPHTAYRMKYRGYGGTRSE